LSVLLIASLAVLAMATLASVVVLLRTGEMRVALLTGLFLLLGLQQGVLLWQTWGEPVGLDWLTASASAGLGIGLLGLLTVLALHRILGELDRAEALHWDSMEGVRGLTELASRRDVAPQERLEELLALGCERLGLEIGVVSRVAGGRYEVLAIHAPESFPIGAGAAFELADTFCATALGSDRALAAQRTADLPEAARPARNPFHFEAYLGCALRVHGEARGTLAFGSLTPRNDRFTASHKELLRLMSQWLGAEQERDELASAGQEHSALAVAEQERRARAEQALERSRREAEREIADSRKAAEQVIAESRQAAEQEIERSRREAEDERVRRQAAERAAPVAGAIRRARRRAAGNEPRKLDLNGMLARVGKRLRRQLPSGIELVVEPGRDLAALAPLRLPLDAIVTSLVQRAAEAMSEGGRLTVTTANQETAAGDPGVMAAVPPARYVTLTVSESTGAIDADALSRVFDGAEGEAVPGSEAEGGLALAAIYRLLQRVGADLSIEVEPGRSSRFIVFLPLADGPAAETPAPPARSQEVEEVRPPAAAPAREGVAEPPSGPTAAAGVTGH
jgi:hypothetical protein